MKLELQVAQVLLTDIQSNIRNRRIIGSSMSFEKEEMKHNRDAPQKIENFLKRDIDFKNMIETLTIPLLLVIAGLICVVLAIIGKISGKIKIIILPERQRILGGVGVVFLVIGLALGVIIQPTPPDEGITPTPTSPITPTPTPSPTATLTPTSPPEITVKITNPKNGSSVPLENTVSGTASNVPDNLYLWVLVFPPNNRWYPNQGRISIFEDGWMMTALVGSPDDSGKKFYIYAVLADEQADKEFQNYMDTCKETKSWLGMSSLPKGAKIYNRIMVIRE